MPLVPEQAESAKLRRHDAGVLSQDARPSLPIVGRHTTAAQRDAMRTKQKFHFSVDKNEEPTQS
jgi:hypothetical protein